MKIIEPSAFQKKLKVLYTNTVRNLFFIILIISLFIILRILIFFFSFSIYAQHASALNRFISFMVTPELALSSSESFLEIQNFFLMIQGIIFPLLLIILIAYTQKKYISILKDQQQDMITLNSIEFSHLKNLKFAQNLENILALLRPGENLILKSSYIYDMNKYNSQKKKIQSQRELREGSENQIFYSQEKPLRSSFDNIQDHYFANKMIITFSNLSIVKELINIYHSGILLEKLKTDLENGKQNESYDKKEIKVIEKFLNNEEDINKIRIHMAQDFHDIKWEYYFLIKKKKSFFYTFMFYVIICLFIWFLSALIEYLKTKNFLKLNFIDENIGFKINFVVFEYLTSWHILGLQIAKFCIQMLCYYIIDYLLNFTKFSYQSSQQNFNFIFTSIFELIYTIPATHYGYMFAIFHMKGQLEQQNVNPQNYFLIINSKWNEISFTLLAATCMKIIYFWLKKLVNKLRKKPQEIQINNQDVNTSLINVFMYLGFYQSLLTPISLIICCVIFLILHLFNKNVQKNENYLRIYLSYHNISMIQQFALFSFGIGGFLSFNLNYNFSQQYFYEINTNLFLPYYFITCVCICVIFSPTLYMLMRHNSVSMRVLNNLSISYQTPQKVEDFKRILEKDNYQSNNPYYKEKFLLRIDDNNLC